MLCTCYLCFLCSSIFRFYTCSITKSCLTLCDLMDYVPGSSVLHYLQVCSNSCPLSWWCYLTISSSVVPFSSCLQSFPASGCFPMSQHFPSGGPSIGASALASVLPMNIQGWFALGLAGLISLQSKGLSRVFSSNQFKSINSLALSFLYGPTRTSRKAWLLEKP